MSNDNSKHTQQNTEEPEKTVTKKKKSIGRMIANALLYLFVSIIGLLMLLFGVVHYALNHYAEQIVGEYLLQKGIPQATNNKYSVAYEDINVQLIAGWSIHDFLSSGSITLNDVILEADSAFLVKNDSLPIGKKDNVVGINAKRITLQNISLLRALFQEEVYIGNIVFDSVTTEIHKYKTEEQAKNKPKKPEGEKFKGLQDFFDKEKKQFKRYRIGNIEINKSHVQYYDHTRKSDQEITIGEINTNINDIYLDSATLRQRLLPIHIGSFVINTKDVRLELDNAPLGISLRKLEFSTLDSSFTVFNTSLYKINNSDPALQGATIPLISLEGIDIPAFFDDSTFYARRFNISQPRVNLDLTKSTTKKKSSKKTKISLPPILKSISIDQFYLENANVPFETTKLGKREVHDFSTSLKYLYLDNYTLNRTIPAEFDFFDVRLGYQSWRLPNDHYAKVGGLYYHSKRQKLYLYSPAYKPRRQVPDSTSHAYVNANARKATLKNLDYKKFLKQPLDSIFHYQNFIVDAPSVEYWVPTHPQKKKTKTKEASPLYLGLDKALFTKGRFKLYSNKDSVYRNRVSVENINFKLDSLYLPLHDPLKFDIANADLKFYDLQLKDLGGYNFLLEETKFSTSDSSVSLHHINIANHDVQSKILQIDSHIDDIEINDIGWRNYLATDSLVLGTLFIDIPSSEMHLPLKEVNDQFESVSKQKANSSDVTKKSPLKYLRVNDFVFRKGPISVYKPDNSLLVKSTSTALEIEDFELKDKKVDWEELHFVLNGLYVPIPEIHHQARINEIRINAEKQELILDALAIVPTREEIKRENHILCGINEIKVTGLDYHMLLDIQQIDADSINIEGFRGIVSIDNSLNQTEEKVEEEIKKDSTQNNKETLKYIGIRSINLNADDLSVLIKNKEGKSSYATFYGGKFILSDVKSQPSPTRNIDKILPEDVFIKFKGLQLEGENTSFKFTSSLIIADTKGDSLILKETNITPQLGYQNVSQLDSAMALQVGDLAIKGAGFKDLIYNKKVDIDSVLGKNIYVMTPAKSKQKKVVEGESIAERVFPKEQINELLEKFTSIHIGYIDIDQSQVSFRTPKKEKSFSRLMKRQEQSEVLKRAKVNESKFNRKYERILGKKKLSNQEKKDRINSLLQDTLGFTVEVYPLVPSIVDTSLVNKQNKSLLIRSNENDIKDIHLTIKEINVNEETMQTDNQYIQIENIDASLGKNNVMLGNGMYSIAFDSLNFNTHYENIYLKNFGLIPAYSKKDFGVYNEFQTDRIEISIPDLLFRGFHIQEFLYGDTLHLNGLEVDQLSLSAYRDKSVPIDPFKKDPKMPHEIFEDVPMIFSLDTVTITDSSIDYEEFKGDIGDSRVATDSTGGKSGQFQLNDFTGQIFNITNDTAKLVKQPFTEMFVKGTLMDQGGELKMYFRIPPLDSLGTYYYEGQVGEMDLIKLNPLIERLELVKVKDGHLKRMYFKVLANDSIALGNMQFRYKNLEVDVLKDKEKKTGELKRNAFFSSVANLLIREENPRFPSMKQGHIYFERNQKKFIFNYWVKTVLSGIASTLSPLMEPNLKYETDGSSKDVLRKRTPDEIKELKMEIRYIEKNTKRKNRLKGPLKQVY
ncbi:hypothetical protein [Flammeovirga sp. SubArs3]|uniref:hypothetical protein n=1 Tax=Flammeovirga sp. SubArs3 TaxID=2995316 RepID=UPI00248C3631|nr:hypothetical protein [Flammeovirga sp. SubArs3]